MLVSNLLLGLEALPKLLRHWYAQPKVTSHEITSTSQEHITVEEGPSVPEYPNSIQMSEKGVEAESSNQMC